MPVEAIAEYQNVTKTYNGTFPWSRGIAAVTDVSLRLEPGEVLGLLGPNRAGKTTLVKMLLSLCRPTRGTILRLGKLVQDRSTLAQVGYVHENHAFPRYLNADELLRYYGALSFLEPHVLDQRVPRLLARVGLEDRASEPIARFSKGMVQRLGLAQALLNEPRLLVLDEPTEGLDLAGRDFLHEAIAEVTARQGGVLIISHTLEEVEKVCNRVAVLVRGQLIHQGRVADLPAPFVQSVRALYSRTGQPGGDRP